jgi:hypothetical protein
MVMKNLKLNETLTYIFDIYIGWFFVNGRKQQAYWELMKQKYSK